MPTALERAGDFSQSVTPSGALISVRDPLTNAPFPGNRIPANRLDPRGPGVSQPVPDAEHDRRQRLQLRHAGAQHRLAAPAAHVPRRLSADRQRLDCGQVPDVLHQVRRHQRRRRLGAVGSRPAALRLRRRHRQDRLHAHPEHVDDPRVLDRLLQQRRGRTSGRRRRACRHPARDLSAARAARPVCRAAQSARSDSAGGVRQHPERGPDAEQRRRHGVDHATTDAGRSTATTSRSTRRST